MFIQLIGGLVQKLRGFYTLTKQNKIHYIEISSNMKPRHESGSIMRENRATQDFMNLHLKDLLREKSFA